MHTKLSLFCDKMIEAGWLAVVILVPVWFNIYSARTFEPDKITLMRSIALVMVLAWLVKIAEAGIGRLRSEEQPTEECATSSSRGFFGKLLDVPLLLPVLLVAFAYIISTVLSISPTVALWGSYQRMQGTYTALSYMVVFALIASHLRTRAQLDRLMTTIILTSLPVGLYGIIQKYGLDPLPWAGDVQSRVASSLGNAIFVASYLIMAIPPTLSRLLNSMRAILQEEEIGWGNTILAAVYIFVLAVDIIAVIFSGSRGPLLGLMAGLFFFILLSLLSVYRQRGPLDTFTASRVALSLLEMVAPLVLGGVLGMAAFAVMGPVSVAGARLDAGSMPALGIMAGVGVSIVYIGVRVAFGHHAWRLWLNWAALAVVMAGFLVSLNVPQSPFYSVRSLPTVGRLGQLFQPGEGTGKVRALIWEGVLNLITLDQPLGIPGQFTDSLYPVRPVIGYGPESMFNAFARVYPPELAHVEARGSSADRAHNETFDLLATLGFLGFVAYYWLIFSLFYYLLKSVGWVPDTSARRRLFALLGAGGVLGAFLPRLVAGSFVFSAVGLPAGMVGMVFVYLVWQASVGRPGGMENGIWSREPGGGKGDEETGREKEGHAQLGVTGQHLVLIGIFTALVAHFIEVHFVFSIAATYVYFWVYAGVVVAWVSGRLRGEEPAVGSQSASAANEVGLPVTGQSASRRRRHRQRSPSAGPGTGHNATSAPAARQLLAEDWETWLGVFGLVVAILLIAMIFDFITTQFDVARSNFSMLWMFGITWFIGLAIGLGEVSVHAHAWRKPIGWGRAVLLYVITSLGYSFFYLLIHRWQLRPRTVAPVDPLQAVFQAADVVTWLFILFYVFVGLLLLLIAAMLAVPLLQRLPTWRVANWWLYPVLVAATGVAILFKNVDVVRADIVLKQAEQYRNQGQYNEAIALNRWSIDLDADEDFYYLMLALAYQLKGQDGRTSPEERGRAWADGEAAAIQARDINRYNPDNSGNLGRYYLTWAQVTPAENGQQQARYNTALEYFANTTYLAPQNVIYYNLWAQTYYLLGRYQEAEQILQKSVAIDSQFDQTQMLLGDTYGALGKPKEAAQAHRAAILMSPAAFADQFFEQRINFYKAYPDQMQEIIATYKEVMAQRPTDASIPRTLGHIYSRLGDHQNAVTYYELALQAGDTDVQTTFSLAAEYLAMENYQQAADTYQQALQREPNNAQAHSNLGYVYAKLGRLDEAIQENLIVLQLTPNDYISRRNLVLLYRDSGRLDQAIEQAQQLIPVTPQNEMGPTYLLIGNLYEQAGRLDEAIAAYEKAVAAAPDLSQALAALGSLYLQQGRLEDALRAYQRLAQLTPDDYAIHQQLALIYRQLGRLDEALAEANQALSKAPEERRAALEQLVAEIQSQTGQGQP